MNVNSTNIRTWSLLGPRGTFGITLSNIAKENNNIIAVTADLCKTSGLDKFYKLHPDKLINVGIAEQNMVGVAAGLAKEGFNVFITTFSTFMTMRACEQIRICLGYMQYNIKAIGLSSGLAMGQFGNTHYGIEDVSLMRAIPNLTIISPADCTEVVKTTIALSKHIGPVFVRLTGVANNPIVYKDDYDFCIGKAIKLKEGKDVVIFTCGSMVHESLIAANELDKNSISTSVINMHTIKPLDLKIIDEVCSSSVKLIVTVEEHSIIGGLGGAISEYLVCKNKHPKQLFIGLPDYFGKNGDYKYLLQKYGLTGNKIFEKINAEF